MKKMLLVGLMLLLSLPSFVVSSAAKLLPKDAPVEETPTAPEADGHRGLENVDLRRDPETQVLNGASTLADQSALVDRSAAIGSLIAEAPMSDPNDLVVDLHPTGVPKSVVNLDGVLSSPRSGSADAIARDFLAGHSALFGLSADEVQTLRVTTDDLDDETGTTYLKYEQTVGGLPVFDSEIGVTITAHGEIAIVNQGQTLPGAVLSTDAALTEEQAVAKAFAHCGVEISADALRPSAAKSDAAAEFTSYANPLGEGREDVAVQKTVVNVAGQAILAYRALVGAADGDRYDTVIDANSGELLVRVKVVRGVANRLVGNGSGLAGLQSRALAEGWSVYWAASDYDDNRIGETLTTASAGGPRRAAHTVPADATRASYADLVGTSAHEDGEVWAATLGDLRQTLGETTADRIVFDGMKNTPTSPSFVNARAGIVTACQTLSPTDLCAVWAVLARHGLGASANGNDGTVHNATFDTPSSCGTAKTNSPSPTPISYGQTLYGVLDQTDGLTASGWSPTSGAYFDAYTFSGTAGQRVTITMNSTPFNTYLRLKNSAGANLAVDNDSNGGSNAKIVFTLTSSGTFTIEATSWDAYQDNYGPYYIALAVGAQAGSTPIASGQTLSGSLGGTDLTCPALNAGPICPYYDAFTFSGIAGQQVAITINSPTFIPRVVVVNPAGSGFASENTPTTITLASSGTHTIQVTTAGTVLTGAYTISITISNGCSTPATPMAYGQTLLGYLTARDCVTTAGNGTVNGAYYDAYTFSGTAGDQVVITMITYKFNTYLRLKNSAGANLAVDNDSNGDSDAKIVFTLTSSGTFTIEATSYAPGPLGSGEVTDSAFYHISLAASRSTCTNGILSYEGQQVFLPSFTTTSSGTFTAVLTAPEAVNYYPSLQKWNGTVWVTVADHQWDDARNAEVCTYNGAPGQYRWRLFAFFNGGYGYQICTTRPV